MTAKSVFKMLILTILFPLYLELLRKLDVNLNKGYPG